MAAGDRRYHYLHSESLGNRHQRSHVQRLTDSDALHESGAAAVHVARQLAQ
jgi:hypothetical protein